MSTLGIVAGGGDLPIAIASECARPVFLVALTGSADAAIEKFPHERAGIGETGKIFRLLRDHGCTDVILAGKVTRPAWGDVKVDARGALAAPKIIAAALRGDDALLRMIAAMFEREGFHIVSAAEAAPALLAGETTITKAKPSDRDEADIAIAVRIVRELGALDIGQAAVVCEGLALAVEAAEGTDAMIQRIASLPDNIRGTVAKRRGVLVKAPKPIQDRKTDLPVIGVQTIAHAAASGLSGIALEAGGALIVNRKAVVEAADTAGLFVTGFARAQ
ncbi:MAG: UDP-2,3-diacylglucosamine diphosphatase LpxI [Rhizomicrobium sp.]